MFTKLFKGLMPTFPDSEMPGDTGPDSEMPTDTPTCPYCGATVMNGMCLNKMCKS